MTTSDPPGGRLSWRCAIDPIIARLRCGELLRQLRIAATFGHGRAEACLKAEVPGFYPTKLTKIETGAMPPSSRDVEAMIGLYQPTPEQSRQLRLLAREARRRARPSPTATPRARQYLSLERQAVGISMVYNEIPGLLQTREFARAALAASPVVPASAVERLADERVERGRAVFRPGGARVRIALGEDALHRASGGPGVHRRQLEHLRAITRLPNVLFRVITRSAGIVAGLSVPFTVLHLADGKPIAFVATTVRGDYFRTTEPFTAVFRHAWERAAPEQESTAILDVRIADLTHRRGAAGCAG